MQFTKSYYYNNTDALTDKGPPINIVDAWLIWQYLSWRGPIKNYLEIGVWTGAVYSLVAEQQPECNIDLVCPRIYRVEPTMKKLQHKYTRTYAKKSADVDWVNIDRSYDIFYAYHPMELTTEIIEPALPRTSENTLLWLDKHPDTQLAKVHSMLRERQWKQWLVTDQLEWWTHKSKTIQPFINYLLHESNIGWFAYLKQEQSVWKLSAPQCVYDNPDLFNQM